MSDLILFWHRRDLRIADNLGLAAARQRSARVIGVFCLDPDILGRDDIAPVRVAYLVGCLQKLKQRYSEAGSQLLILKAAPQEGIPRLAACLSASAVFFNQDVEPYSRDRDRAVAAALREQGVEVHHFWDQLLHPPQTIKTGSGQPYTVYTPFWRNWSRQPKADPCETLAGTQGLTDQEQALARQAGAIELPTAKELGFVWDRDLLVEPGEKAAQEMLENFCDRAITEYAEQRNFPAHPGTSQLSAPLKFGVIGIRTVWAATQVALENTRSDEARAGIQTWQQELAWREFYQHVLYFFPQLAEGPYRDSLKAFPWDNNEAHFQAWCEGKTGYPIVDAAMRQMNATGWMHNRCRMIVASFLTKDLLINWQRGEKYFMQRLIDGDLAANNGGWQWSASSGMDPKPLRIFNPASQAKKFDPDAEYIRRWLPELAGVDTEALVTGKIPVEDCDRSGYPLPIVDHNQRQQEFKQRYQQQKQR
ncbi:deoxyribodipyrimidine photo-lyase [Leptothermofonsia sichuanensis E412]|uniref:FAD-binding domain-containing protein n=1 Tax=Leptothermofonsia sichuanensis TaxID=2917832 RepID=UPI001CA79BC8|nr:FAD-binding domain-containing protein [Leptothermofonsia sichuanensis]QZZ18805.1 deoxyribodipyrimidine photo-lyase [Leptothermofonsia sichuanensis E412]